LPTIAFARRVPDAHDFAIDYMFPELGTVCAAEEYLAALA
jgi:hypothetical protein